MHVSSTAFAHTRGSVVLFVLVLAILAFGQHARAGVQSPSTTDSSIFRVFLKDGHALPAYGEPAQVGDRIIFSLVVRPSADGRVPMKMQLMSLPAASVDVDRTTRYARSIRAAYFAATSGEAEYQAITTEISSTLDALPAISDPALRLQLAEEARTRLSTWSKDHYDYHAADIVQMELAFDRVIGQMRGAGAAQLSMDLVAGVADVRPEPALPPPSLRESIEAALFASRVEDDVPTREALLSNVIDVLNGSEEPTLLAEARRALADEQATDRAYAALSDDLAARLEVARRTGDLTAAETVAADLKRRDALLGSRRPAVVAPLADTIAARLAVMRAFRTALDRYTSDKPLLLEYERQVRPTLSGLDGILPELQRLRDIRPSAWTGFDATGRLLIRLQRFETALSTIAPPNGLGAVHAAIQSVVQLSREAFARHRESLIVPNTAVDADSSAAAAGAMALLAQARQDLVTHLFPPKAP